MRWTSFFSPTLRDAPADAEAISHKLLVRGGFIRQLHSGHYTLLPLAFRVRKKIIKIVVLKALTPMSNPIIGFFGKHKNTITPTTNGINLSSILV